MCAKEGILPENHANECLVPALETKISFQKPLVTPLANQKYSFDSKETMLHSLQCQKGACAFSAANSKNGSAVASSMQNNELCHLESPTSPKSSNDDFAGTLFDLEAQNSSKNKVCKCNFPSKFPFEEHNIVSNTIVGSAPMEFHEKKSNPCMVYYKETHQDKKRKLWSQFDETTVRRPSCLLHKTRVHSESTLSYTLQQRDNCINDKYVLFRTARRRLGKPSQGFTTKSESEHTNVPAQELNMERYFQALQGPELDVLKDPEDSLLPLDEVWPFLLRFPIGCFSICLGIGSQTLLWKTLPSAHTMQFMHIPKYINLILWCLALIALFIVFTTYTLKCLFYFEAVRREFFHPVRTNFFFAPWIASMMLILGIPPAVSTTIHPIFWVFFMVPLFALELKIYGQWLSGGKRRLSRVANPSTHMSLLGNFVGARLAATVGWKEAAIFFWAVGFAHYLVLFVTLYQRSPFSTRLPKELHPVFFLFVATPCTAGMAWSHIVGHFDLVSKLAYFLALFLYLSLVVRTNFFQGFRFSMTWWAYTFPVTTLANATIHYSLEVKHPLTMGLAIILSVISSVVFLSLSLFTMLHIYWGTMFPNDVAIAIAERNYKGLQGHGSCQGDSKDSSHGKNKYCKEEKSFIEKCSSRNYPDVQLLQQSLLISINPCTNIYTIDCNSIHIPR